jgi:hypothetical protein
LPLRRSFIEVFAAESTRSAYIVKTLTLIWRITKF